VNIAAWVVTTLLVVVYLGAGVTKLLRPALPASPTAATQARVYSARAVRTIGTLEVAGAFGLVLPWLTGIMRAVTPISALGFVMLQVLAIHHHTVRKEPGTLPLNAVLLLAAVLVCVARFTELG
jgi:DoxX-like family